MDRTRTSRRLNYRSSSFAVGVIALTAMVVPTWLFAHGGSTDVERPAAASDKIQTVKTPEVDPSGVAASEADAAAEGAAEVQRQVDAYLAAVEAQREAEAAWYAGIAAARAAAAARNASPQSSPARSSTVDTGPVSGCPAQGGAAAVYIYMHESGCDPSRWSSNGCFGLGQACPGSKLPCGADFTCQDAWFTAYASRYGGWEGALAFWQSHHWW